MMALVLTVLLSATLLAFSLLQLPGGVRRLVNRYQQDLAGVYLGESAIVAWMEQFPADYFAEAPWNLRLPAVQEEGGFPWLKVSAAACTACERGASDERGRTSGCESSRRVVAQVGSTFRTLSRDELREVADQLEANLNREILGRSNLKVKSGSRRFTGRGESFAMNVSAGDVTLGFDGNVGSVNIKCDGDVNVRGAARYDTLRLYASGNIVLTGEVNARHLEVYSRGNIELSRAVSFSGIMYSSGGITLRGMNSRLSRRRTSPADCVDTTGPIHLISVAPTVLRENHQDVSARRDATLESAAPLGCLLPAIVGGKKVPIQWSLE